MLTQERGNVYKEAEETAVRRYCACRADGWPPRVHVSVRHCDEISMKTR